MAARVDRRKSKFKSIKGVIKKLVPNINYENMKIKEVY